MSLTPAIDESRQVKRGRGREVQRYIILKGKAMSKMFHTRLKCSDLRWLV